MALTSVGSLGTVASTTANQSSLVLTTSATLNAGNLGVLIVAVDSFQSGDGDEGAVSGVVDSGGGTWTKAAEFTNGQITARAGATCSVWWRQPGTDLNSGATITASFTNTTSRDAAAATAWEFGTGGAAVRVVGTATLADDGVQALGSLNLTTSNIECLRIRAAAVEGRNDFPFNPVTTGWAEITAAEADTGSGTTSMEAMAEFNILTATGSASAPTLVNNSRDVASVYVVFVVISTNMLLMF